MVIRERFSYRAIHDTLSSVLEHDLHAKRVSSLCDATLGVLHSGSLAICAIGQGLAAARSLKPKHAIKQVDRLLSNEAIVVDDVLERWVPFVIGSRDSIVVAMDWTDFDADNQATIMLALISDHGRSTPLVWLTVDKRTLKDHRTLYEHRVLVRLAELVPAGIKVCIVADRGFGDQKLYQMLAEELYFDFVIRFRGNITVTAASGETRTAADWVQAGGRARLLRGAEVTADRYRVGTVVCVELADRNTPWRAFLGFGQRAHHSVWHFTDVSRTLGRAGRSRRRRKRHAERNTGHGDDRRRRVPIRNRSIILDGHTARRQRSGPLDRPPQWPLTKILANVRVGTSVGSEKSVPEEVDHREIAVRVQMVDKVKLLLAPEPSEACEARSFDVVFLVKIYVRVERRRAGSDHYEEQIERKNKKHSTCDEDRGDEKVGRVVSFVATIGGGHEMALGIVCMMKSDVVPVEDAAYSVMAEAVMEQGLAARYDQMGTDGS